MSGIDQVSKVSPEQYFGTRPAEAKGKLDMNAFMRLLTVQLANQNPLEPMNDRDFFAQMAQLGQVEGSDKMQKRLDMMQATSMMGKTVDALRPMTDKNSGGVNDIVTGEVVRMTVKNGERMLGIKEANGGIVEVRMENIREIRN